MMVFCNGEGVKYFDVALPFFLNQRPFLEFASPDYNWESDRKITLMVKTTDHVYVKSSVKDSVEDFTSLALSGCPLECPFDPNENFDDALNGYTPNATFRGVDYLGEPPEKLILSDKYAKTMVQKLFNEGVGLLSNVDSFSLNKTYTNPIYIPIRKSINKHIDVLVGCDGSKLLKVLMMGPEVSPQHISVDELFMHHCPIPRESRLRPLYADTSRQVQAIYEKIHGGYPAQGKVFIEFVWSDPKRVFEPPANNALVKLAVKPFPGDANPFLKKLWDEIGTLDCLFRLYETSLATDVNKSNLTMSMAEMNSDKIDELTKLLNQQYTPHWEKMLDFSDSLESNLERVSKGDRTDVDFTDRVWKILAGNDTSLQDVMECFHIIFSEIESKLYRPYLFPTNKTLFSDVLKRLLCHNLLNFRTILTPSFAIALALDCGINKLFKDYSFVLRMCHLAETSDLDLFSPQHTHLKESLDYVKKLHCMLEVLCLSKERLGISMSIQESQTRRLFQYLSNKDLEWNRTYHFDITTNALGPVLEGMIPVYWNLKFETRNELKVNRTTCAITRDFYMEHAKKSFMTVEGLLRPGYYIYVNQTVEQLK